MLLAGDILSWGYERQRFRLGDGASYTPDFDLVFQTHVLFVEIKGRKREAGMAKFRIAAGQYWWYEWKMIELYRGQWRSILEF